MGKWQSCEPCLLGTLFIDWKGRRIIVEGIGGIGYKAMTPQEVITFFEQSIHMFHEHGIALVYWVEQEQLCFYGMDEFTSKVWDPLAEEEGEQDE